MGYHDTQLEHLQSRRNQFAPLSQNMDPPHSVSHNLNMGPQLAKIKATRRQRLAIA